MKLLARENAAHGVTFNAVLPGRIATDRLASGYGGIDAAERTARDEIPAARLGTPEEVAAAAVFLLGRGGLPDGAAVARRRRSHPLLVVAGAGAIGAAERPETSP